MLFGVIGLVLRLNGYLVIPLVLGLILGPLAEEYLLRSFELADGPGYFFGSVVVNILWAMLALLIAGMIVLRFRRRRRERVGARRAHEVRHRHGRKPQYRPGDRPSTAARRLGFV